MPSEDLTRIAENIDTLKALNALQLINLIFMEEEKTSTWANTESALNRIKDPVMAEEQVEASKLLILQQSSMALNAQANMAPQFLLALFS